MPHNIPERTVSGNDTHLDSTTPEDPTQHHADLSNPATTMLAIARVRILVEPGMSSFPIRALADSGSQLNLITYDRAAITGIGGANTMYAIGFIDTWIQHRTLAEPLISIRLLVVSRILPDFPLERVRTFWVRATLQPVGRSTLLDYSELRYADGSRHISQDRHSRNQAQKHQFFRVLRSKYLLQMDDSSRFG